MDRTNAAIESAIARSLPEQQLNRERVKEGGDVPLLRSGMHLIKSLCLVGTITVWGTAASLAMEQPSDVSAWLRNHIGEGEGQIAQVVLQRARALYLKKVAAGVVKNPCYFAMDATRPNGGRLGKRFYTICEADRSFRAVATGHGSGRKVKGAPNFTNGKECAKNFGNALEKFLTTGGAYVTAETRTLFKGYYRTSAKQDVVLMRSFVQFDGEGETANARERDIGGHPAVLLRQIRYRWMPRSPYANENGCVPVGSSRTTPADAAMGAQAGRDPTQSKSSHCSSIRRRSTRIRIKRTSRRLRKPSRRAGRVRPTAITGTPFA